MKKNRVPKWNTGIGQSEQRHDEEDRPGMKHPLETLHGSFRPLAGRFQGAEQGLFFIGDGGIRRLGCPPASIHPAERPPSSTRSRVLMRVVVPAP